MIPKTIHYCWFGGNLLPELARKCIESWEKVLPEYKIVRWDENNFDVTSNQYVREAYEAKKYAFVSDYVRLYALYHHGGVYMDTDVEVIKPLDNFLKYKAFSGFENESFIPTGIMACEKGFKGFGDLLHDYNDRRFIKENGAFDITTNVAVITEYYYDRGLVKNDTEQMVEDFKIMPSIVFCPSKEDIIPKYIDQIVAIHHKSGSWLPIEEQKKRSNFQTKIKISIKRIIKSVIGRKNYGKLLRIINRLRGLKTYAEKNKR